MSVSSRRLALTVICFIVAAGCANAVAAEKDTPKVSHDADATAKAYRLTRIVIPPDSQYRKEDKGNIDHPPDIQIELFRNGEKIGHTSQYVKGWEVEFSQADADNKYVIDPKNNPTFFIKIWDHDWFTRDDLILSITGLTAKDFESPIKEKLSKNDPPDRAVVVTFEPDK